MATILRQLIDGFLEQVLNDAHSIDFDIDRKDDGVVELRVTATPITPVEESSAAEAA